MGKAGLALVAGLGSSNPFIRFITWALLLSINVQAAYLLWVMPSMRLVALLLAVVVLFFYLLEWWNGDKMRERRFVWAYKRQK